MLSFLLRQSDHGFAIRAIAVSMGFPVAPAVLLKLPEGRDCPFYIQITLILLGAGIAIL